MTSIMVTDIAKIILETKKLVGDSDVGDIVMSVTL